jgi:putative peptidoglycan lipid II flippase
VMNGPVSWLSYAFRFQQLPLGLFGVSIATATLPAIARSAAVHNLAEFRDTLSRSIVMILLMTVPSSVGLMVLGESMIGIVYQHGRFTAWDTHQTALALSCYAVGIAGYSILKLVGPAFYALGDARTPMFVSMGSVAVNGLCAFTMVRVLHFGHAGLALSLSLVSIVNVLILLAVLGPRIGGLRGGEMAGSLLKILLASAPMGLVCLLVVRSSGSRAVHVMAGIPAGAVTFYAAALALRVPELKETREIVLRKVRRKA